MNNATRNAVLATFLTLVLSGTTAHSVEKKTNLGNSPERIVTPMPDGWMVIYHAKDHRREVLEYVPEGQSVTNWQEMVTSKIFDRSRATPHDYNSKTIKNFAKLCTKSVKIVGEKEDRFGYDASLAFIECQTKPETRKKNKFVRKILFQVQLAIRGKDALYIAESAWQTDDVTAPRPTQDNDLLNRITSRLDNVFVCDDRLKEKSCNVLKAKTQ